MLYDRPYLRETPYRQRWSATVSLIIANAVVYALQLLGEVSLGATYGQMMEYLALSPARLADGYVWQLATFQFLHAGAFHLLINCVMLYLFGRPMEETLGRVSFLRLYFGSGVVGGLLQVLCSWVFPTHFGTGPVVGASAGVFGLIAAFAWLNRDMPITTLIAFIIPVTMKAKYLLVVEAVIALLGSLAPPSGIAHAAHLGGILTGVIYAQLAVIGGPARLRWRRARPAPPQRELVVTPAPKAKGWSRRSSNVSDDLSAADFMSKEVDPILDKISAQGIQSLTERERKILELARRKMSRH